jgi:Leucine-rich repeat (LRR) protein
VLTEENLVRILSSETEKLCLENHYWLSTKFVAKIGWMAPNLQNLSLRRMPNISNVVFADIFRELHALVSVDLCDCTELYPSSVQLLARNNANLEYLQLSGCFQAIDDSSLRLISKLPNLTFMDISHSRSLTDKALEVYKDKTT